MNEIAQKEVAEEQFEEVDDSGFELEIVDDTPEEDKGKPRRAEDAEAQIPEDSAVEHVERGPREVQEADQPLTTPRGHGASAVDAGVQLRPSRGVQPSPSVQTGH